MISNIVNLPYNINRQDPSRLRHKTANSSPRDNNGREEYTWANPHFASVGEPIPVAFHDSRLFNNPELPNIKLVFRPVVFEFKDTDPANVSLLEKITNTGTGSNIIDYCMRNKFDTVNDWTLFFHHEKNKERFPQSTLKALGQIVSTVPEFDPYKIGASRNVISTMLQRYSMYEEWKSRIFTIFDTIDQSGMLSEYIKRGMLTPSIDDVTKRSIDVIPCFDWADLKTNSPDFYEHLRLAKDEQIFANNKVLEVLKQESVSWENVTPEQIVRNNRTGGYTIAENDWEPEPSNPEQEAYATAIQDDGNVFLGYLVLSNDQKDVIEAIEKKLDLMLKTILLKAVPHTVLTEHVRVGDTLDSAKSIEILRSMQKIYTDVNENDLTRIFTRLTSWKIPSILENPQSSINGWKSLYDILRKFNKIDEKIAVQHLVNSLNDSYELRKKMVSRDPFNPISSQLKNNLKVQEFFDNIINEHQEYARAHPQEVQKHKDAKRKQTANSATQPKGKQNNNKKFKSNSKESNQKNANPTKRVNPTTYGQFKWDDRFKFNKPQLNDKADSDQCGYCGKRNHPSDKCFLVAPDAIPANWYCKICKSWFDPKGLGHKNCKSPTANCVTTNVPDDGNNLSDSEEMPPGYETDDQ